MSENSTRSGLKWRMALLLSCGVLVNYFDRINLTVSHDAIRQTFGISDVVFGLLLSAYNLTYAMSQIPAGLLLDRLGVRRLGTISGGVVSLASFGAAASPSVFGLFLARFLLGVGESPLFPGNAKAIGQWFSIRQRMFAMSLVDSSAKLSSALGVPILGYLLLRLGWRLTFSISALLTLLYLVIFATFYREPTASTRGDSGISQTMPEDDSPKLSLPQLLAERKVIGLAIGMMAYNYSFYLMLTWLPTYLSHSLGIDPLHAFFYTGFPWLAAVVVEIAVGGWWLQHRIDRGADSGKSRLRVMIFGLACGSAVIGTAHVHTALPALFWITLSIAGGAAATPAMWAAPSMVAPRKNVATVGSIMNLSGQIAGISAPVITGYIHRMTGKFSLAFTVAAVLQLCGILAYLICLREMTPIVVPSSPDAVS